MKKLLILADSASIHTEKWLKFLAPVFEVHLISFASAQIPGVKNHNLKTEIKAQGGNFQYLLRFFTIWRLIRQIKPDLINAHYLTSYGFLGALFKKKNTPLIISLYGTDLLVTPRKNIFYKWLTRFTLDRAEHIFSVAHHFTKELKLYTAVNKKRVSTIQYGVEVDYIQQFVQKVKAINFISTRAHVPNSNIEIIIKAFELFLAENPAKLWIVGESDLTASYRAYVASKGLDKNIIFTGRLSEHRRLFELLGKSKYFISLPSSDGMALSLLEAFSAQAVPILSNIPANQEWVQDEQNGYLTDISIDALYQTFMRLEYDENMVGKNMQLVRQCGDIALNSQRILQVFKDCSQ